MNASSRAWVEERQVTHGARWGQYELLEVVGRGGMATVVRAICPPSQDRPRIVALKFLHRSLQADPVVLEAFRREALLGMQLRHTNLGRTFGIETRDGRVALVLEYVDGFSLSDVHRHILGTPYFRRSPEVIAQLIAELCRGLQALHELQDEDGRKLGAVHRDVTPQNVIVTSEGKIKLVDFGIVFSPASPQRTATGMVKGKLAYLSPEYLMGKIWDHRIDVWSVGVVLWEMLTGRRLFKGETPSATVSAVLAAQIPSPATLRSTVPAALCRITARALARNPHDRYDSMSSFARDLEAFVEQTSPGLGSLDALDWLSTFPLGAGSAVMRVDRSSSPLPAPIVEELDEDEPTWQEPEVVPLPLVGGRPK